MSDGENIETAVSVASSSHSDEQQSHALPPVLSRLIRGTFFLALKTPLQAILAFVSIPLVQSYVGDGINGAYVFAWGFGFLQFLLEFGMGSALQRHVADAWTRNDREEVNRCIACGMSFYAGMVIIQMAALLGIAYIILPTLDKFNGDEYGLIVKLLWLQALTSPFYGLSTVLSSVLQAARRYEFIPRLELLVIILRFTILIVGIATRFDFFYVVVAQTVLQIVLITGPSLWVMVRELGYRPHFFGANWTDMFSLLHISGYMFLMQLSVVLADKIDTTLLGFALPKIDAGPAITIYQNVSKPFLQIRQMGWMLAYLVMPAVASLAAARDVVGLDRIKFDGSRYLVGLLLPITLLAGIYAGPFLHLWVGARFVPYAYLLQLFLVATLPLVLSIVVQMAIGIGKIQVIAISVFVGSLINLPISYVLTRYNGVSGVIWGTVLTTLISNFLIPAIHIFPILKIEPRAFFHRTLSAPLMGGMSLFIVTMILRQVSSSDPGDLHSWMRYVPFATHLAVGLMAYVAGYVITPTGRSDLILLSRKLRRRAV